jgi:phosphate ABC transporter phosphate-binding protein
MGHSIPRLLNFLNSLSRRRSSAAPRALAAIGVLLLACGSATGQTAERLSQVKKVYVQELSAEGPSRGLREKLIHQLQQKGKLEVLSTADGADAVIKPSSSIWPTGYVSTDPRSPSGLRQRVYRGFLSVEVLGKGGEPLWSYLVTPARFRAGDIASDLADQLVTKFLAAMKQSADSPTTAATGAAASVTLTAAGGTFPAPLYQRWFESFTERRPNVRITYNAIGSEAGIQSLLDGQLDFAASDMPLSDARMAEAKRTFLHFASVIGAVVPAYNLSDVNETLNFTPEILAGIYLGKIRKWNDPAIRAVNRTAPLPDADIVLIHRSDGSGTTFVWTDYLSKVSPEWNAKVGSGTVVQWPAGTGTEGNEGVATAVQEAPNSIGYVELVYALRHQLSYGRVRNAAGRFVQAALPSVTAAGVEVASSVRLDSRVSITNAPGKDAYPIASFTWWLVPKEQASEAKRSALVELLRWMLTSGQKECSALGYVPLPREITESEMELLRTLR